MQVPGALGSPITRQPGTQLLQTITLHTPAPCQMGHGGVNKHLSLVVSTSRHPTLSRLVVHQGLMLPYIINLRSSYPSIFVCNTNIDIFPGLLSTTSWCFSLGGIGDDDVDVRHDFHHGDGHGVCSCGGCFVLPCLDINTCSTSTTTCGSFTVAIAVATGNDICASAANSSATTVVATYDATSAASARKGSKGQV